MTFETLVRDALGERAAHRRLVAYVVRQVAFGRHLEAVLADPYVVNRTLHQARRVLLDDPAIPAACRASLARWTAAALRAAASARAPSPSGS